MVVPHDLVQRTRNHVPVHDHSDTIADAEDRVEIVRLGLECSPCFERTCRFGHYNCLRELKPRPVIEALERLVGDALTLVEGD